MAAVPSFPLWVMEYPQAKVVLPQLTCNDPLPPTLKILRDLKYATGRHGDRYLYLIVRYNETKKIHTFDRELGQVSETLDFGDVWEGAARLSEASVHVEVHVTW